MSPVVIGAVAGGAYGAVVRGRYGIGLAPDAAAGALAGVAYARYGIAGGVIGALVAFWAKDQIIGKLTSRDA